MSFLNKLWKNLRDSKSSTSPSNKKSSSSSNKKSSRGTSNVPDSTASSSHANPSSSSSSYSNRNRRTSSDFSLQLTRSQRLEDVTAQVTPSSSSYHHHVSSKKWHEELTSSSKKSYRNQISNLRGKSNGNNDRNQNDLENTPPPDVELEDEEVILPPGIVSDFIRNPNISRNLSVSRSGRYKHRSRKRSDLFDVVKKDTDLQTDILVVSPKS